MRMGGGVLWGGGRYCKGRVKEEPRGREGDQRAGRGGNASKDRSISWEPTDSANHFGIEHGEGVCKGHQKEMTQLVEVQSYW